MQGSPLGLLNSSAKIAIAAETGQPAATVVTENILNMRERLTPGAISPVWLYNPTVYKQLFQLQVGLGTAGALVSGQNIQSCRHAVDAWASRWLNARGVPCLEPLAT